MSGWLQSVSKRGWSKRINGQMHVIVQTSGTSLPFCCYAGKGYLGPAPTLEAAKLKCEKLDASSREPTPIEKSVENTTKPRTTRLPRR